MIPLHQRIISGPLAPFSDGSTQVMSELKRQESLVDEATVLEYLARYPEFFLRHGAMLDKIRIPHGQRAPSPWWSASWTDSWGAHRAAGAGDHRTGWGRQRERADLPGLCGSHGGIYGCQTLFELSAVMGKAFVQRLRLTGLRLWLNPRHFQLSGPEQRFLAQGKTARTTAGAAPARHGLLFRSPQPEREAGAVWQ